jgi:uncharacterized protein (TIGR03083 family)
VDSPELRALTEQLDALRSLVDGLEDDEFARPTRCPGWTVAELVAHCEGMLVRLVGENAQPVDGDAEIDRVGYYRYEPDAPREDEDASKTFSEVVLDRVIDEVGGRSPEQLRAGLDSAIRRVAEGARAIPADRVIKRSGHPRIAYAEFVASRNLEFGVHAMDIADAVRRPELVAPSTATVITAMLDGLLGAPLPDSLPWDATTYILTGTGRRPIGAAERAELGELAERFPLLR